MIWDIILLSTLANYNVAQDGAIKTKQPIEQAVEANLGDRSSDPDEVSPDNISNDDKSQDTIFDDFDIDAPFDESLDIGVDWPDQDKAESANNVEQKKASDPLAKENISAKKEGEVDSLANSEDIGEERVTASDQSRLESLEFDDDISDVAEQGRFNDNFIELNNDGEQNYNIFFSGLEDIKSERLLERFNALSALRTSSNRSANGSQILRRARTDIALMERLLRLEGYYDNLVEYNIQNNQQDDLSNANINVILEVLAGPQYQFGSVNLTGLEASEDADFLRDAVNISRGDAVQQDAIIDGKLRLQERLLENGYAFGIVGEPDLLIDHARREGDLTLAVTPDRKYRFGRILTAPDAILSGKHLENIARFDQGDIFKQSNIIDLRQAIFATSLASNITLTPVQSSSNPDQVDLNVELDPAPPRTIAGQLGFNTGEGFRIEASWEHRNFFPPEGAINIAGILGTREQAIGLTFRRNNFKGRDRVLTATFAARNQDLNAFDARSINIGIGYERKTTLIFQKKWTWNAGVEYALSDERAIFNNAVSRELFNIVALPAGVNYDGSDDLLDPRRGFRLSARIAPEFSVGVADIAYFKAQIDGSAYQPVNERLTLAGRIRLGSITGAQTASIAPSRRNFAGGGSSVRGFGFQDIGPLDSNGNPTGGRGLAEFALEARYRIGAFGIVPFIDAGNISNSAFPDFDDLRFAAGVGLRYYTSFGPVRVDVGTPFNRRPGESVLAVAISLGQAF